MRVAVFFTPPPEHPLTKAAALWLGRDAFSGEEFSQSAVDRFTRREVRELTASPRRYGFHATLQAPFRISDGHTLEEVEQALDSLCAEIRPPPLSPLRVTRISSFFALTPSEPAPAVNALAAEVVHRFDRLRTPPSAEEIERRQPHRLSERQRTNLERWGYPYVFEDFRFHMTLTGAVPKERWALMQNVLEMRFRSVIGEPLAIDALALFIEESPPGDFMVRKHVATKPVHEPLI